MPAERKEAVRATEPAWLWPAMVMCFIGWTLVSAYAGYRGGYQAAIDQSEQARYYVNGEMRKIGFCKWLTLSNFADECSRPLDGGQ